MKKFKLVILTTALAVLMIGCGSSSVPTKVNPNLPKITSLKTISDMNEVGFEWLPVNDEQVIGYELYRLDNKSNKFKAVAKIEDRFATHYVDENLEPNTTYTYKLLTYSKDYISNDGDSVSVTTKPLLNSVPFIQAITGLPGRAKIIWRPHPDISVVSYIVKRADEKSDIFKEIAIVKGRLNAEYIDSDVKHGNTYKYTVFVKTGSGVVSNPSQIVKATTKELPKGVKNIQATQNEPKKIVLTWDSVDFSEFSHYNIYRTSSSFLPYTYLAKTKNNTFEDLINSNGEKLYYKVTVVDIDGLESLKQSEPIVGKTLAAPNPPKISVANFDGSSINLEWSFVERAVSYTLYRSGGNGKDKAITDINSNIFTDTQIEPNSSYKYKVVAVDQFGIASDASSSVSVSTK